MDDIEAAALVRSGLTSVALDRAERGRLVADLLLERINATGPADPQQLFISPHLVLRGSTAPPRGQREGRSARNGVAHDQPI
jgi:LacI family transcriptional regulator